MLTIRLDDLSGPEIQLLLALHYADLRSISPPEGCHVLDLSGLKTPDISFWSVWDGDALAGCGALKQLSSDHAEIKSMRTVASHIRRGVAAHLLRHMFDVAATRGYRRLSLETGASAEFEPARNLYLAHGFVEGAPFGDYRPHPFSRFMHKDL